MTSEFLYRLRAWFINTFTYESPDGAADVMADATRWGWLPALSGVAIGAGQARVAHLEPMPEGREMPG